MKDPVCGMEVAAPPPISVERSGVIYGFCSQQCKRAFEEGKGPAPMVASSKNTFFILAAVFAAIIALMLFRGIPAGP